MPDQTPAQELRVAAGKLRESATDDEWWSAAGGTVLGLAHPSLALPLADWLELTADVLNSRAIADPSDEYTVDISDEHALLVARAILDEVAE